MIYRLLIFASCITCNLWGIGYATLKSSEINMRVGPGREYPIIWVLTRVGLPVEVLAEFGQWRKVRLPDNTEGWIHQNMVSHKNNALVASENVILYSSASNAHPIARLEKGVIVHCIKQEDDWVKIEVNKIKGWVKKNELWGVQD